MGRPELCVLFGQTFVHPHLDEYVDEVIFAEPVVINACEFIEQSSSSLSPAITLVGATSPPSFALEVFVQCEGETRFRRLCQPFLYSHSSSNVLEVEAIVTSHLVVRGSYRSLSLVIYGNTAEDLGQFNIEVDLDSSLTNLVCSTEGKLDDLPPALHSRNRTFEELISFPKALYLPDAPLDICIELKQFLQLIFKILELSNPGGAIHKVVSAVVSTTSSYVTSDLHSAAINQKRSTLGRSKICEESKHVFTEARKELLDFYQSFHHELGDLSAQSLTECTYFESKADLAASKLLMDLFNKYFQFQSNSLSVGDLHLPQNENVILGLSIALLLCCARESCFHFVNGGGMEQLACVFRHDMNGSTAITLMLLGVVEQATRHSIGCEGFLGWWPREDENVPSGTSEGYTLLLKLLLQKQRHDVASLATYVLHRLRLYEVVSRYECAVLSLLGGLSAVGKVTSVTLDMLINAKSQLKKLLKLINSRDPIEDPSPVACASRSLIPGQMDGLLSYKSTSSLIASSNCCFSISDVDSQLLSLLKERGFLPLSAALLSSSILRSEVGHAMDIFVDIASLIEAIILSLLFCRSGLIFLLLHPELCATLIISLRGVENLRNEESVPLRYASMLISKGFVCRPREVGTIVEMHLRVVYAIDCLLTSTPNSEEFLWVLWELCGLSRSACGRQALLSLGHFPEAVSVLMEALHSVKELEPGTMNSGVLPINLAIFHSASEIFEVIVSDSTASSLVSWIEHAMELHKALHSSSPGSNKKDAPMRLLEWVDAGAVYYKYGAMGLLRYAAVLASGGDAHLSSTSMLVSDSMDVENAVGDSSTGTDVHVMENLAKTISEKSFDGVTLRDSSVAQLTTAFRILAFISENAAVAAALYNEGAVTVIYAVLVNCRFMLERSSNSYDYLVDDGTECNSTSELLMERNREQGMVDLLIPSLVLLNILLRKLQEANEQHRNTKLMNALLRLHRELSPKLAASAADLSSPYPDSAISFGAVCHLLVSALASWPVYGWTPGLFHSLLANVQATSLLALGPKETCSLLCLMNDLFPEEDVWLWKKGMPFLSALRTLAVGTLLGPQKESQVDWYLQPGHLETLLSQLAPQLEKIAQVILHYAISTLVVIQDMVRVFIIRVACQKAESASVLLRPIFSWVCNRVSEPSSLSETDAYKVHKLIDFLAGLLEHPRAKPVLLKEGVVQMLTRVLERSVDAAILEANQFPESINSAKCVFTPLSWCLPVFKLISLLFESKKSLHERYDKHSFENVDAKDCSLIFAYLFKLCQVLPIGRELLACLITFKEISSCSEGQRSLAAFIWRSHSSSFEELESENGGDGDRNYNLSDTFDWQKRPPLLWCWKKLLSAIDSEDGFSTYAVESVGALCSGALRFSMDGKSLNSNRITALKYLFGIPCDIGGKDGFPEENINYIEEMTTLLISKITDIDHSTTHDMKTTLYQVSESAKSLLLLMQKPTSSVKVDDIISSEDIPFSPNCVQVASRIHPLSDGTVEKVDDYSYLGGLADFFVWECPENLPDRLSQTAVSVKKKMSALDGQSRRGRVDNSPAELMAQSAFSRGSGPPSTPSGPTRRDTFRQRKPNTSRPPSMHVDDYVARERNVDGNANSNVIAVQRVSSTSGRPPSIHVDEFMARQRERQNPVPMAIGEVTAQAKNVSPENAPGTEKLNKSRPLKTDLDDDLQGIDIVFDGVETEFDDKLPFHQPDDNLQLPPPVIVEQNSPHSIVAETESDANEISQFSRLPTPLATIVDENTISSSRISASRPDMPLTREPSVSSEKKYTEQSDESIIIPVKTSSGFDSAAAACSPGFPAGYNKTSASSVRLPADRTSQPNFYATNSLHPSGNIPLGTGSQGLYDQKFLVNQPPLPPMPPPPSIKPVMSQNSDHVSNRSSPFVSSTDVQPPPSAAFHVQAEYLSSFNNSSITSSIPMSDSKYSRNSHSSPSTSARPPPPLPPTPPPFTSTPFTLPSLKASTSHSTVYNQANVGTTELPQISVVPPNDGRIGNISASGSRLTSYPPPPLLPPFVFGRPASVPMNIYSSSSPQLQGDNPSSILQNLSIPQPIQSLQSLAQLQPLQPPQLPRPPQPPQHLRPPIQPSLQSEAGVSLLQTPVQLVQQPLHMLQQPQASPVNVYYHPQQQDNYSRMQQLQTEHAQPQSLPQQGDSASQQEQDSGMSLQQFFSSPEAIQSLLSDRDKLCQLLEQHPKLMQMLQERLGQL